MNEKQKKFVQSTKKASLPIIILGSALILLPTIAWFQFQNNPYENLKGIYKPLVKIEEEIGKDKIIFKGLQEQIRTENESFLLERASTYSNLFYKKCFTDAMGSLGHIMKMGQLAGVFLVGFGIMTRRLVKIIEEE